MPPAYDGDIISAIVKDHKEFSHSLALEPTRHSLRSYVAAAMARGSLPAFGCPRYPLGKPLGTHHAPGQDFTLTTHLTLDKPYAIGAYFVQC